VRVFLDADRPAWIVWALAAAGLGMAVKWWGAFMVFPIAYALYQSRSRPATAAFTQKAGIYFLWGLLFLVLTIFLVSDTNVKMYNLLLNSAVHWQPVQANDIRSLLDPANTSYLSRGPAVWGLSMFLGLICYLVSRLAGNEKLTSRLLSGGISAASLVLILSGLGIAVFMLFFDLPFVLAPQFYYSLKYYGKYFIAFDAGSRSHASIFSAILGNAGDWWRDVMQSGFLSPVLVFLLIFAVLISVGRITPKRLAQPLRITLIFLVTIMAALFLFVTKKNWATQAMLYPLLIFFVCSACLAFWERLSGKVSPRLAAAVVICVCLGLMALNLLIHPNVLDTCESRRDFGREVVRLNAELMATLGQHKGRVLFVNRQFPMNVSDTSWSVVKYNPNDKSLAPLVQSMDAGDFLVIDEQYLIPEIQSQVAGLHLRAVIFGQKPEREGGVYSGPLFTVFEKVAPEDFQSHG
jgi:hypothetical protein